MRRIMIVDDELLVRAGIKSLINWEEYGYQVVCDAGNGEEAKEKLEQYRPDIIFTDLKMEPGDGFELIRYCKRRFPHIRLVVLSNYNDFDNVRKAMKLGASDYLFKLMVKKDELLEILGELEKEIPEPREGEDEDVLRKNLDSIKRGILKQLEEENPGFEVPVQELFWKVPIRVDFQREYRVLRLWLDNMRIIRKKPEFEKMDLLMFTMQNMLEEIMNRIYCAEVFPREDGEFVIIFNSGESGELGDEELNETGMILSDYIYRYYGVRASMAASGRRSGWEDLRQALKETEAIRSACLLRRRSCVLMAATVPGQEARIPEELSAKAVKERMEQGDLYGLLAGCRKFLDFMDENREADRQMLWKLLKRWYRSVEYTCQNSQIETEKILDKNGANLEEAVLGYDRFEDLKDSLNELLDMYGNADRVVRTGRCREEVELAKRYIKANLAEPLSVSLVAGQVNMSESRFSHVFKEDTGMTLGEYIMEKRMNWAARLLRETEWKIGQISDAVGMDNSNYFSTQFRRRFSVSPVEYRRGMGENLGGRQD